MEDCAGLLGKTMNSAASDCYVACLVFSISSLFPADVTADVLPEVSTVDCWTMRKTKLLQQ
jgi:hypothetical protein